MSEEPAAYEGSAPPESRILHLAEDAWTKVPLAMASDARLGGSDLNAYVGIAWLCGRRGWWYGHQGEIQETVGLTEKQVRDSVRRLREAGYILTEPMGLAYGNVLRYVIPAVARPLQKGQSAGDKKGGDGLTKRAVTPYTTDQHLREKPKSAADASSRAIPLAKVVPLTEDVVASLSREFGAQTVAEAVEFWTNDYRFNFVKDRPAFLRKKLEERSKAGNGRRNSDPRGTARGDGSSVADPLLDALTAHQRARAAGGAP